MTSRERFLRTLAGEPADRPPLGGEGIREDVREEWAKQGYPVDGDLVKDFAIENWETVQPELGHHRFWLTSYGEDNDAFERTATDARRYPEDWDKCVSRCRDRAFPVGLNMSRGLLLTLGVEAWRSLTPVLYAVRDDPDRVAAIMDDAGRFALDVLDRAFSEIEFDYVLLREPIASNYAPVIGPWSFRATCERAYERLIGHAIRRGVRWIVFQSYGNATPLVPEALRVGCNVYWAGEVGLAGTDYLDLRRRFGGELGLIGGIDAALLERDISGMESELRRLVVPLVRGARYLPLLDGRVRANVPFSRYAAYRAELRKIVDEAAGSGVSL